MLLWRWHRSLIRDNVALILADPGNSAAAHMPGPPR